MTDGDAEVKEASTPTMEAGNAFPATGGEAHILRAEVASLKEQLSGLQRRHQAEVTWLSERWAEALAELRQQTGRHHTHARSNAETIDGTHAQVDNSVFVRAAFRILLQREAKQEEAEECASTLKNGASRYELLCRLADTPEFLRRNRRYALVVVFLTAAVLTPPDVFTQLLLAGPLIVLYEISVIVSVLARRRKPLEPDDAE